MNDIVFIPEIRWYRYAVRDHDARFPDAQRGHRHEEDRAGPKRPHGHQANSGGYT